MSSKKIRAFLNTDVLLEYIRGKAELRELFSEEVRARAAFATNDVVLQELLLACGKNPGTDLAVIVPYLEVLTASLDLRPTDAQALRTLRNRVVHVNDVLILAGARSCDVLLTYDDELLEVGDIAAVRSETPEAFLHELGAAA
jgi:predicted nucleic acid-binding protein